MTVADVGQRLLDQGVGGANRRISFELSCQAPPFDWPTHSVSEYVPSFDR